MAIQEINIGNLVNDGTGDDLRTAFDKVNQNFTALNNELAVTGENVGTGDAEVFVQKDAYKLQFRKFVGGDNITITENATDINISTALQNLFNTIVTDTGTVNASSATDTVQILGGNNVRVENSGNTITIDADLVNAQLTGPLDLNGYTITGSGNINITGNVNASNFTGSYGGFSQTSITDALFVQDFGSIVVQTNNAIQGLYQIADYDFGSVLAPSDNEVDLGSIV